ncbi:17359_t:CDS:10 [Entrophospora sp. SA101]|nr:17359_t:CDS:10 [Entrophospora sp. SA101]
MLSDEEIKTKRQTIKIKPRTINPIKKSLRPNLERVDSTTSSNNDDIDTIDLTDCSNSLKYDDMNYIDIDIDSDNDTINDDVKIKFDTTTNNNIDNDKNKENSNNEEDEEDDFFFTRKRVFVKKSPTIKKNKKSLETISKIKKDATIIKESICLIDVDKGDDCVNIDDDSSSKDITPPPQPSSQVLIDLQIHQQQQDNSNGNSQEIRQQQGYKAQEGQVQEQSASNYTANKKIQINVLPIRHPNIQITEFNKNGIEEFEKPINFLMDFTDNFQIIMDVVSSSKQIPKQNLILTYNNFRVFQLGTPASLGITDEATFEIYTKDTYDFIKKQKEHQKYLQLGLFDDQTNNNYNINGNNEKYSSTKMIDVMDLVDVDGNSCNSIGIDNVILSSGSNIASSSYDYLHLKLLEASNTITKLRVKKTLTIQAVMSQFKRMKNLLDNMQFRLKFEDEFLSPTDQVGNTDLEDGDMINKKNI